MAYTVKKGDTLSKLYGSNWKQLSGYTGDPTKLQIGAQLNDLPGTAAPPATAVGNQNPFTNSNPYQTTNATPTPQSANPFSNPNPYQTPNTTQQSTTQNPGVGITAPVVQKPIVAPPMTSLTSAGQSFIKARTDAGRAVDELTVKQEYRDRGFENKYGSWTGSNEQYKAMGLQDVQDSFTQMQQKIAKEGIQNSAGQNAVSPGGYNPSTGGMTTASNQPTEEFVNQTPEDYQSVTQSVLDSVGTTDLAKLIEEFSGGSLTTPEFELSKEEKEAQLTDLKNAAAQGLSTIQKSLAQRGMTFSGIRTEAEANQAAEVLSKESGINRVFAGKIIAAARQEQGRRETALTLAENNYNKALEAQGYVYNPITNTIEKTLARQKFESDENAEAVINYPNSYDEWMLAGGKQGTGMEYGKWLDRNVKKTGGTSAADKDIEETFDRIMSGGGSLLELTNTEIKNVKNKAFKMGLFDTTVPLWFKDFVENNYQKSFNASTLKTFWDEYRAPMLVTKKDEDEKTLDDLINEATGG